MSSYSRWYEARLRRFLEKPFVHIVFGARQTGKSTLIRRIIPPDTLIINLAEPQERMRYLGDPQELIRNCRALKKTDGPRTVFIDEVQLVPDLFNAIQSLYDEDKTAFRFILCGSSARRLKATGANLLPGRSILHRLFPLISEEYSEDAEPLGDGLSPLPLSQLPLAHSPEGLAGFQRFPVRGLEDRLAFGDLPGIAALDDAEARREVLKSYAAVHLEGEIRREASLRDLPAFLRFLRLAAVNSGSMVNIAGLSREVGISAPTIRSYYQLLEDMFIGFTVPAFSGSEQKSLVSAGRFYFFDMGVRNAAAGIRIDESIVSLDPGHFFEQWVGMTLYRKLSYLGEGRLSHYRTRGGAEIDFILEREGGGQAPSLLPIEAKWTQVPSIKDARHLRSFIDASGGRAKKGFIVCRCSRPQQLDDQITAIPWHLL
jgi:predicted AAA+ superfamily ATPase